MSDGFLDDDAEAATSTRRHQLHPWHGLSPRIRGFELRAFIENVPLDEVKYEVDRDSGLLRIDQPLVTSALPPYAYGFVPGTLCGPGVARSTRRSRGDNAALDVFVLSERSLRTGGVIADVRLVGGIRVRDDALVDDKLITVLAGDAALSGIEDIDSVPIHVIERITHFLNESSLLGGCQTGEPFDRARALELLTAGVEDYRDAFS